MNKKHFSLPLAVASLGALPLVFALPGCAAPNENTQVTANTANDVAPTPAVTAATPKLTSAPTTKAPDAARHTSLTAIKGTPDPAYTIVKAGSPGYLPDLEKVRVSPPPKDFKVPANAHVVLQTNKGDVTIELNTREAPLHTKSFYYLAKIGFYNGTRFHRFANLLEPTGKGDIIQGGDPFTRNPETSSMAGQGGPGYQIPREHNKLTHQKLVIAAARGSDPNSAGSQFYITQDPVPFLDEGDGYTVFGKVVKGGDVALKLRQDDVVQKAIAE